MKAVGYISDQSPTGGSGPARGQVTLVGDLTEERAGIVCNAEKNRVMPRPVPDQLPVLDRKQVQQILPYSDPFLFIDEVMRLDLDEGLISARFYLTRAEKLFGWHIPTWAVLPAAVQIEAISQAGMLLYLLWQRQAGKVGVSNVRLTHILGATFLYPVTPGGYLEIVSKVIEGDALITVVGQCLQCKNLFCSCRETGGINPTGIFDKSGVNATNVPIVGPRGRVRQSRGVCVAEETTVAIPTYNEAENISGLTALLLSFGIDHLKKSLMRQMILAQLKRYMRGPVPMVIVI